MPCSQSYCSKMEVNEEKLRKFRFHFPVLLVPCSMAKTFSKKNFVIGHRTSEKITYHKVASSNTSCLEGHDGFFRLLMKEIFDL